jgi:hypothetical protein
MCNVHQWSTTPKPSINYQSSKSKFVSGHKLQHLMPRSSHLDVEVMEVASTNQDFHKVLLSYLTFLAHYCCRWLPIHLIDNFFI